MKKKGLIISTAVMVVVLIAALTTSTFAWFSQSADVAISEFNLTTNVADGLQIATYYFDDASGANFHYTSGNISKVAIDGSELTKGNYWGQGDVATFGSNLTISTEAATISNMYGASGNGLKMFKNASETEALKDAHPETFKEALPNVNFYQLDFALQSTSAKNGQVFIKELSITPSDTKGGMAASARIALFATATAPTSDEESHFAQFSETPDDTWKFLYDPYGDRKYDAGVWSQDSNPYHKYADQAGAYATATTKTLNDATAWQDKYILGSADTTYTTGAIAYERKFDDYSAANTADAKFGNVSAINAGQIIYLRIVIWFDGEDSACNQTFAGGGFDVKFNFGLKLND